jgi:6-phosphofructo-2-kinase
MLLLALTLMLTLLLLLLLLQGNVNLRLELMHRAVEDMLQYLNRGGECAILDGTNFTQERRNIIQSRVAKEVSCITATTCT